MIDSDNIIVTDKYDKKVLGWFNDSIKNSIKKRKNKKVKKKEITEQGSYCPKMKPGQCWAYSKDNKEEEEE